MPRASNQGREFYRVLHRIADRAEPGVAQAIRRFASDVLDAIDEPALVQALTSSNAEAALRAVFGSAEFGSVAAGTAERTLRNSLLTELAAVFGGVGAAAGEELAETLGVEAAFTLSRPEAAAWAREHSAELVSSIGLESRTALRSIVVDGIEDGVHPTRLSRIIREGRVVGLSGRGGSAVSSFRRALEEAAGGSRTALSDALGRRLTDSTRRRIQRAFENGTLTASRIDGFTSTYSRSMLDFRSTNIARTETIRAGSAGQNELWTQEIRRGTIPQTVIRQWLVTPDDRLCPICEGLIGAEALMGELFVSDTTGDAAEYSPIHPQCRCVVTLKVASLSANAFVFPVALTPNGRRTLERIFRKAA